MDGLFDTFLTFILLYKYVGLFLISFVAAFIFPLPSGTTLAAAGAFAAQGYLSFPTVIVVALAGNIAGDAMGYFIARRYGITILAKVGFSRVLHLKYYLFANEYLHKFPQALIFFSRFFTQANALVNILAGIGMIPWRTFFIPEVFGEIAFVLFYGFGGFLLGAAWEENVGFISDGVLAMVLFGLVVLVARMVFFQKVNAQE